MSIFLSQTTQKLENVRVARFDDGLICFPDDVGPDLLFLSLNLGGCPITLFCRQFIERDAKVFRGFLEISVVPRSPYRRVRDRRPFGRELLRRRSVLGNGKHVYHHYPTASPCHFA